MDNISKYSSNRFIGKAGEYRVLAELLKRGINTSIVCLDDGIDLILLNGLRIQVKSATKRVVGSRKYLYSQYVLNTRSRQYRGAKLINDKRRKLDKSKVDFVIGWCVDDDYFYILPVKEIPDTNIFLNTNILKKCKYEKFKNAWHLLEK